MKQNMHKFKALKYPIINIHTSELTFRCFSVKGQSHYHVHSLLHWDNCEVGETYYPHQFPVPEKVQPKTKRKHKCLFKFRT